MSISCCIHERRAIEYKILVLLYWPTSCAYHNILSSFRIRVLYIWYLLKKSFYGSNIAIYKQRQWAMHKWLKMLFLDETFCCLLQSNGGTFSYNAMPSTVEKRAKVVLVYICCRSNGSAWKCHWYQKWKEACPPPVSGFKIIAPPKPLVLMTDLCILEYYHLHCWCSAAMIYLTRYSIMLYHTTIQH